MNRTIQEYLALPELRFPIHLKSGFVINELQGVCRACNKPIHSLHGETRDYEQCTDVIFVGLCYNCKIVVTCRFRHYKNGRVIAPDENGNWDEMVVTIPLKTRLKNWWDKFFKHKK